MSPLVLLRQIAPRDELGDGVRLHHPSGQSAVCAPESLATRLEEAARALGFVRAQTVDLSPFGAEIAELDAFLTQGRHGVMSYLEERLPSGELIRQHPAALMPGARSAWVVALPYAPPAWPRREKQGPPVGSVAAYAGGADYHLLIKERLLLFADVLADLKGSPQRCRACVDTAPLLERQLARKAGFAFLGKHTLAIAPGAGSYFNLGVLLLEDEAPTLEPALVREGCGTCQACSDACPTGALDGAFRIDATRCISYLTIEFRGVVPRELRASMGTWVFGCDLCQTACPWNAGKGVHPGTPALKRREFWEAPPLLELLTLNSNTYKRIVKRTALRRIDRSQLVRNAAIALGNVGSAEALAPLFRVAAGHPTLAARVHATWALGQIALREPSDLGREYLIHLAQYPDPAVCEEAALCLSEISAAGSF